MRKHILVLFFILFSCKAFPQKELKYLEDSLLQVLNNREYYIEKKDQKISGYKQRLKVSNLSASQKYEINNLLIKEYHKYRLDSAEYYIRANQLLAKETSNIEWLNESQIYYIWFSHTKGDFALSISELNKIDSNELSPKLKTIFYETVMDLYDHYAQTINEDSYRKISYIYKDSLISVLDQNSLQYKIQLASKEIYIGDAEKGAILTNSLLENISSDNEYYPLLHYYLSRYHIKRKEYDLAVIECLKAGISDIQNCIKDYASFPKLATLALDMGEIDQANFYVQLAVKDASDFGGYYRTTQSSRLFSVINETYMLKEEERKETLALFLSIVSILSIVLIIVMIYTFIQFRKISRIKRELRQTNKQLNEANVQQVSLNTELKKLNENLLESNFIKEKYIAHFFDTCSNYIEKLEVYRKSLNKKFANKDFDSIRKELKSSRLADKELDELYVNFDEIFLSMYPSFIPEFNDLLLEKERIYPKEKELLNTELRIFALIKLGITNSTDISTFLRCSLRTVYNYRSKIRNKALESPEEFEARVMKIGSIMPS